MSSNLDPDYFAGPSITSGVFYYQQNHHFQPRHTHTRGEPVTEVKEEAIPHFIKPHLLKSLPDILLYILNQTILLLDYNEEYWDIDPELIKACLLKSTCTVGLAVIKLLVKHPVTTATELMYVTGHSKQSIMYHLTDMVKRGVMKRRAVPKSDGGRKALRFGLVNSPPEEWVKAITRFKDSRKALHEKESYKPNYEALIERGIESHRIYAQAFSWNNVLMRWLREQDIPQEDIAEVKAQIYNGVINRGLP